MKNALLKPGPSLIGGLLLSLPAACFILASLLKYWLGAPAFFDAIYPELLRWGVSEGIGWNINLLILFGPLLAILWNLPNVLAIDRSYSTDEIKLGIHIYKRWGNLSVIAFSGLILLVLFLYLLGENCR